MAVSTAVIGAITSLLPTSALDVVAVYTQDFRQVFPRARPIKAVVKEEAKVMEHPLENGSSIIDYRIIQPIEIDLSMILQPADYRNTYLQIKQFFLSATLLVVQTRSGVYSNMLISSLPHEEDPSIYNTIPIALTLKETLFANTQVSFSPRDPKNSSTVKRGNQQPNTANAEDTLKASAAFEKALKHGLVS